VADLELPLRTGTRVQQTIHDASPIGDGGLPGRSLGRMDDPEVAAEIVRRVNRLAELEAEVRRLEYVAADGQHWDSRRAAALARAGFPRIAALLTPAGGPEGT
jgi:hypothetical protein